MTVPHTGAKNGSVVLCRRILGHAKNRSSDRRTGVGRLFIGEQGQIDPADEYKQVQVEERHWLVFIWQFPSQHHINHSIDTDRVSKISF